MNTRKLASNTFWFVVAIATVAITYIMLFHADMIVVGKL